MKMSHHVALICIAVRLLQIIRCQVHEGSKLLCCHNASLALNELPHLPCAQMKVDAELFSTKYGTKGYERLK